MRSLILILLVVLLVWFHQERERLSKETAELTARAARAEQTRLDETNQVKPWFQRHLDGAARGLEQPAQPVRGRFGARGK